MHALIKLFDLSLARANDPRSKESLRALAGDLERFYLRNNNYYEQAEANDHSRYYEAILPLLVDLKTETPERKVRVLEMGAGKTGFPEWLEKKGDRDWVDVTAQDISDTNGVWLNERVDHTVFGDATVSIEGGPYDLAFCTFVYEHLVRPDLFLKTCHGSLRRGGILVIFCPRYDVPGYIPPALRRLPKRQQLVWNICLSVRTARAALLRTPTFWIATRPAALTGTYFRDADAVHLVSKKDLTLALKQFGTRIPISLAPTGPWDWFWSRALLLCEAYKKD